eukprot:TRINITY_DN10436_c0_g1_i1.p1 TRINITY_DN10436_c0_g1~~TRINITY_DN10436_c0_g1_i1.p1  ORF type:complete len:177 (-),score=37.49 TRINITY_DN10436_c0_g1_i1:10-540(-)
MGSCLGKSDPAPQKDRTYKKPSFTSETQSKPLNMANLPQSSSIEIGRTPTDTMELEQEMLRRIISQTAHDFIDTTSVNTATYKDLIAMDRQFPNTFEDIRVPTESQVIFALPKTSEISLEELNRRFDFQPGSFAMVSQLFDQITTKSEMKIHGKEAIIVNFPILTEGESEGSIRAR